MEKYGTLLIAVGLGLAAVATVFVMYVLPLLQKMQEGLCRGFGGC